MSSTHPKISDNEMRYFQFKARQLCELMKDEEAWIKHCSGVSREDCSECPDNKKSSQSFKTIGIQVTPRKPLSSNKPLETKSEKIMSLDDLKARLEHIEFEMEKIYETSLRNAKKRVSEGDSSGVTMPVFLSTEQKKAFIQESLKSSLAKIDSLLPGKLKKSVRPIKSVNSGYVLPHDLQKKHSASRKAYLASLENSSAKKKVLDGRNKGVTIPQRNPTKPILEKIVTKTGNKTRTKTKTISMEEETLVKSTEDEEIKDQNIEYIVDGILDDLLREAVIDLNRIKLFGSIFHVLKTADQVDKKDLGEKRKVFLSPTVENTKPKMTYNIDSAQLFQLKSFLDLPCKLQTENKIGNEESKHTVKEFVSIGNSKDRTEEQMKIYTSTLEPSITSCIKPAAKFTCGVSHTISLNPNKAKEVTVQVEDFWKYLNRINRVVIGKSNPWALCNAIADSIVDDCIDDVAQELCNVPSALIKFLYNQEFLQQVQ